MSSSFSVFSRFGRAVRASFARRLDITVATVAFLYGFFLLRESLDRSVPDGLAYYLFDNGYVVMKYAFSFVFALAVFRLGLSAEPLGASNVPFARLFSASAASLRSHWKTSLRFARYVFLYLAIAFFWFFVLTKIVGFAFPNVAIPIGAAYLFVKLCWSLASAFLAYRLIRAIFAMPNAIALWRDDEEIFTESLESTSWKWWALFLNVLFFCVVTRIVRAVAVFFMGFAFASLGIDRSIWEALVPIPYFLQFALFPFFVLELYKDYFQNPVSVDKV